MNSAGKWLVYIVYGVEYFSILVGLHQLVRSLLTAVFATDIAMDIKFHKYDNKTVVSSNGSAYTFNSSFSWVHFNVFTVPGPYLVTDTLEGCFWFLVDDRIVHLSFCPQTLARISHRSVDHLYASICCLSKVIIHCVNWVFFLVG